jgi:hypothetical protein
MSTSAGSEGEECLGARQRETRLSRRLIAPTAGSVTSQRPRNPPEPAAGRCRGAAGPLRWSQDAAHRRADDDPESLRRLTAFVQGLEQLGWSEGRNLRTVVRFGAGDAVRLRKYAEELVAMAPDIIMTTGSLSLTAALQATRGVPIVFAQVADPVGAGYVTTLASPARSSKQIRRILLTCA